MRHPDTCIHDALIGARTADLPMLTVPFRCAGFSLLLDPAWTTPLALFSSVQAHTWRTNVQPPWAEPQQSWLQSQPIRQHLADDEPAGGGGACASDEDCNLNGQCTAAACVCDPQWQGPLCGSLALLPADPLGGHRRTGFSGWGGNPFFDAGDQQ